MEFEKGKTKVWQWQGSKEIEIELATKEQVEEYQQLAEEITSSKITTKGKIYFQKQAVFPRVKLKEIVDNQVTRKIENAEYIVVNKEMLDKAFSGLWYTSFYKEAGDTHWTDAYPRPTSALHIKDLLSLYRFSNTGDFMKILSKSSGKKFIFDEDLGQLIPRNIEVKGDLYEKLHKMLSSKDKQSIKIGVELLSNLNYNEYEPEILMLLNRNIRNIRTYQTGHIVAFKSLIKAVQKDYPKWDTEDKLSFILNLLEKNQRSRKALEYINEYFNEVHPLSYGQSYQISIIDEKIKKLVEENELAIQE